jgi:hypothetical protein
MHTGAVGRGEFVPGEVLVRRQYLSSPYRLCNLRWQLEDSNGTPLTTERIAMQGREITLDDGKPYLCRSGWRRTFKVSRMSESMWRLAGLERPIVRDALAYLE